MISLLVFALSLPLAVYTYAGCFGLIDQPNRLRAVVQLTVRLIIVAALLVLTPAESRLWIGVGFLLVAMLHIGAQLIMRYAINSGRWMTDRIE